MIEILIVGITMGLTVIASTLYRGQRRVRLLRVGCIALFVATVCRGVEPMFDGPGIDLLKRYALLIAQACVVLIILTFRSRPAPPWMTRAVYLSVGLVALGEMALVTFLPIHPDGTVFHQSEVAEAALQGQAWALIAYHCLYLAAFAAATAVVATGCWLTLVRKDQPRSVRISVACILFGALGSFFFIGSSILDLFGITLLGGSEVRDYVLIIVVAFFFVGLATGVIRRVSLTLRENLALRVAKEIVIPLWRTTTTLHPGVKLPPEELVGFNELTTLSRLTIETHDALRLIREDDDPALELVHEQNPQDPHLSASLIQHLSGSNAVPPLGWLTLALSRSRIMEVKTDQSLTTSVRSLYEIRLAMNEPAR